ncbi:TetR/AcrR family transcriptional regulator [Thalassotalea profundi]|uniref:TetR family transcriptional regulator n=1 Tax=Thalassotalea profundi TaxID=2036687 RepID=A0ABQ3IDE6_9GAMM|nr:TetR/AcrR family transcriptional regulator [Thalassotalea profundi]GHE77618.1 TetR family transcriptional regulator [Thalassotalea profundi]
MAKQAKFDRQAVINLATNLYWHKGFHATSMRNLQEEVDMRPGSIYAAFGSKEGLFKEALKNYTDMAKNQINQCKQMYNSPIEALSTFIKALVLDTRENAPNGMCMLAKTISELTPEHQELIDITKSHLNEIASEFVKLIQEAQNLGQISQDKSAEDLANYIQVQITGLRTFAKITNDKSKLETMIDDIFTHYPF